MGFTLPAEDLPVALNIDYMFHVIQLKVLASVLNIEAGLDTDKRPSGFQLNLITTLFLIE